MMALAAMQPTRSRTLSPRRFAWLLWLALLLPIAQLAATSHLLAHAGADASAAADARQAPPHAAHCDLCLLAAAVGGGAAPTGSPSLRHPRARHAAPQSARYRVRAAAPAHAYRSRAPPLVPR